MIIYGRHYYLIISMRTYFEEDKHVCVCISSGHILHINEADYYNMYCNNICHLIFRFRLENNMCTSQPITIKHVQNYMFCN